MLGMRRQARIMDRSDSRIFGQHARECQRTGAFTLDAQCHGFGADSQVMCRLGTQRAAEITQGLCTQLRDAPLRGREALVVVRDIGIARPVKLTRIRQASAQRIAVTANRFGQCIEHQACAYLLGTEQIRRGHRVIDDVKYSAFAAQRTDTLQIPEGERALPDLLDDLEKQLILRAYERANGVKTETARLLGIKTPALYYKLEKYGIGEISGRSSES